MKSITGLRAEGLRERQPLQPCWLASTVNELASVMDNDSSDTDFPQKNNKLNKLSQLCGFHYFSSIISIRLVRYMMT